MWDLDTAGYPADNIIPYVINPSRPAGLEILPAGTTEDEIVAAIRNVFQVFENVSTSKLRFQFLGVDHSAVFSVDGAILVTLDINDPGVNCTSSNFKIATLAPVTGAYTLPGSGEEIWIERQYSYLDYDIALCGITMSIDASPGTTDLASLLTHELGHMLGQGHSIAKPTSMSGYGTNMRESQRSLSRDDGIGISVMYPDASFFDDTGQLKGLVLETDALGVPVGEVFGAHLTVIDDATGETMMEAPTGVTAVDGLTGRAVAWDASGTSGRFVLSGLPPGDYRIRVDAYDGPSTVGSTGKIINLAFWDADSLGPRRDFGYLLDTAVHSVFAGASTNAGTLRVGPFDPDFPNVDSGIISRIEGVWIEPALAISGQATLVGLAKGINTSPEDSIYVDGTDEVELLNPRWSGSGNYILVDAVVGAQAPVGPHTVIVQNSHGFSQVHGGLMISAGPPVITQITPACPLPLENVQIDGQNFTFDSLVLFNGVLGTDIIVQGPNLITATAPAGMTLPVTISFLSDTGTDAGEFAIGCQPSAVPDAARFPFEVGMPYPTPSSRSTSISLRLPDPARVEVSIFDLHGRRVRVLPTTSLPAGLNALVWDGKTANGTSAASGRYFARIRIGEFETSRTLILVR